jgi:hypothetical protein
MPEMATSPRAHKIGTFSIFILVGGAVLADLVGLIPLFKDITDPIFWILASIYMWHLGLGLLNGRKLAITAVSFVAGMIPVIQEFPELTAGIVAIIIVTRLEEKADISSMSPLSKGELAGAKTALAGAQQAQALNQDGRRNPNTRLPLYGGEGRVPSGSGQNSEDETDESMPYIGQNYPKDLVDDMEVKEAV